MLRKDFVLRMKDIKEHVRLIDRSFVPRTGYADNSHMIDLVNELVNELECLAAELRGDLTS